MIQRQVKPDPYCSFKDDRERRIALMARDVRLVAIALIVAIASPLASSIAHRGATSNASHPGVERPGIAVSATDDAAQPTANLKSSPAIEAVPRGVVPHRGATHFRHAP